MISLAQQFFLSNEEKYFIYQIIRENLLLKLESSDRFGTYIYYPEYFQNIITLIGRFNDPQSSYKRRHEERLLLIVIRAKNSRQLDKTLIVRMNETGGRTKILSQNDIQQ